LEKVLERKPRDCESCGFSRWVRKDKIFIIQQQHHHHQQQQSRPQQMRNQTTVMSFPPGGGGVSSPPEGGGGGGGGFGGGGMEWICPDCALQRGLPPEHYHKNFYSEGNERAMRLQAEWQRRHQQAANASSNGREDGCVSMWGGLDLTTFLCKHY
jgi:hypothetical protein